MSHALFLALLHASILELAAGSFIGFLAVRKESPGMLAISRILGVIGFLAVAVLLVRRGVDLGSLPLVSRFDSHLAAAALSILVALAIDLVRSMPLLTIAAMPLAATSLVFAAAIGLPGEAPPTDSVVRSPLSGLHVTLVMLAYAAFEISFVASVLYLIEHRNLKARTEPSILGFMPSLEASYRLTGRAMLAGLVLLTAGAVLGYQQGRTSLAQTPHWRTDPKILITTGVWLAYLLITALSLVPSLKGRRTAVANAVCFVAVMAASWATAFWSGFHRHF